jgi:hypothetical protein
MQEHAQGPAPWDTQLTDLVRGPSKEWNRIGHMRRTVHNITSSTRRPGLVSKVTEARQRQIYFMFPHTWK